MSKQKSKAPKEVKPETVENKAVGTAKTDVHTQGSSEVKEPVKDAERPATAQEGADERNDTVGSERPTYMAGVDPYDGGNDSIASHSAQVTEGDAAQARAEGVDLKEKELDPHDGAQLDAGYGEPEFDVKKEEKLAHAKAPEQSEAVREAIVNPNGVGNEWPR